MDKKERGKRDMNQYELLLATSFVATALGEDAAVWVLSGIAGPKSTSYELVLTPRLRVTGRDFSKDTAQLIEEPYGSGIDGQATFVGDSVVSINANISPDHWNTRKLPAPDTLYDVSFRLDRDHRVTDLTIQVHKPAPTGAPTKKRRGRKA